MQLNQPALISMAMRKIVSTNEELHMQEAQLSIKTENQHFT
jgi:hypothetical protein